MHKENYDINYCRCLNSWAPMLVDEAMSDFWGLAKHAREDRLILWGLCIFTVAGLAYFRFVRKIRRMDKVDEAIFGKDNKFGVFE